MEMTLVTGATGLIGYHITTSLMRRGRSVRALVRSVERARRILPEECELMQGDVTDKESVKRALEGCSVVYHAAGWPEQWKQDPNIFQRVNVGGTQNVVEAALEQGVRRFLYTSTVDVFYAEAGQEFDESILDPRPKRTYYERSKQEADRCVADAVQKGLPAIFLHPDAVYGPGPSSSPGANALIVMLQRGQMPALPPGGFAVVFAPDVGEGHVLAEAKAVPGSRYILSEAYYEFSDLARLVLEEFGMDRRLPPVLPVPIARVLSTVGEWVSGLTHRPPLLPHGGLEFLLWRGHPCADKARRELGWSSTPFRAGIHTTIESLLRMPNSP